jgi:tRNA G18 (ribose-2'-O)-methylase SpoU
MGEAFNLPYARLDPLPAGLAPLRRAGIRLLALTPSPDADDIGCLRLDPDQPVALLLGAEGPGLTEGALTAADQQVRIPMAGTVDSINVGSAAAVAFYAVRQARRAAAGRSPG